DLSESRHVPPSEIAGAHAPKIRRFLLQICPAVVFRSGGLRLRADAEQFDGIVKAFEGVPSHETAVAVVQKPCELFRGQDRLARFAADALDTADEIDVRTDHGEIEAFARSNVAVADDAVVQSDAGPQRLIA